MSKMIHPLSDVACENIRNGSTVWQYSIILAGAQIGNNCNINSHCFIENDVVIGNDVFVGPNVAFTNDSIPRSKVHHEKYAITCIENNASIRSNSTILGEYAMIGAGSVVTKSVPPFTLWYGNPACHKGYVTKDAKILDLSLFDKVNNEQYCLDDLTPILKINDQL